MTQDDQWQLIAALLSTGDLAAFRRSGLQPLNFENTSAQIAATQILLYADNPLHGGKVPAPAYLAQFGVFVPAWNSEKGTVEQLCAALNVHRGRKRVNDHVAKITAANIQNPLEAFTRLQAAAGDSELLALGCKGETHTLRDGIPGVKSRYFATKDSHGITGYDTPLKTLTRCIRGTNNGAVYTVFAPPKNFKTTFSLFWVDTLADLGLRGLVVTTEMPHEDMEDILSCMHTEVDYNRYLNRMLTEEEESNFFDELDSLGKKKETIHFLTPRGIDAMALAEVEAEIERLDADGQLGYVLWDGHYRSASEESEKKYELARRTKQMALRRKKPFILTAQEGSEKGEVSHKVYMQESDVVIRLEKFGPGLFRLASKATRKGYDCVLECKIDFAHMRLLEMGVLKDESIT